MASITRYDPFNDLVDDLFKGFLVRPVAYEGRNALPRLNVDVAEKNGAYVVKGELPGVKKEDIAVEIDGNQVSVSAEVKREKEEKKENLVHSERFYGKTYRSFTVRHDIDRKAAAAKFSDGVLELTLPKANGNGASQRLEIR